MRKYCPVCGKEIIVLSFDVCNECKLFDDALNNLIKTSVGLKYLYKKVIKGTRDWLSRRP